MARFIDGPASPRFQPLGDAGDDPVDLPDRFSTAMRDAWRAAPQGEGVSRGIPFRFRPTPVFPGAATCVALGGASTRWIVFAWVVDVFEPEANASGFIPAYRGAVEQGRQACRLSLRWTDGVEVQRSIRRGREIGHWRHADVFSSRPTEAHAHISFRPDAASPPDICELRAFTFSRMGGFQWDPTTFPSPWVSWLFAVENPRPDVPLEQVIIYAQEPLLVHGVTLGDVGEHPLRWRERRKLLLEVPAESLARLAAVDDLPDTVPVPEGAWEDLRVWQSLKIDLGEICSVAPALAYDSAAWLDGGRTVRPSIRRDRLLVEYSSHPDARLYLPGRPPLEIREIESGRSPRCEPVAPAHRRVKVRIVDAHSGRPLAARLHAHGGRGEYLPPEGRHRRPVRSLLVDDGIDDIRHFHLATYVDGEASIRLPDGDVFFEVTKGFEFEPVRHVERVGAGTEEIVLRLHRAMDWQLRGWVTADTHVHALSPTAALLQTAAEGVNFTHLLASQWGEYMSNTADFDGRTTLRRDEGDHPFLVRVGTENRQQHLGHISLLAYSDRMILPLCSGGPDESALGDPVEVLLTEWAEQCRRQGGIVVLPHFEGPRCEGAAAIVSGNVDAVEMCAFGKTGIDPYSLSAWYRYLNCGFKVPAVGGTDKMLPTIAIGRVRTYARLRDGESLSTATWADAVRRGETFVTYGPLVEFSVEGRPAGSSISLGRSGGTLSVSWRAATLNSEVTRVELVRNGEIIESTVAGSRASSGGWSVRMVASGWLAILIRTRSSDGSEVIAAHSSAVYVHLEGSQLLPAADALSILEQIEGAIGFLDTLATRADADRHRRMRMRLTTIHRQLHERMHAAGLDHAHGGPADPGH